MEQVMIKFNYDHDWDQILTLNVKCKICGNEFMFDVVEDDYIRWKEGELIQNALPYLKAGERELLISGTCDSCWDKMFGDEE
jgi:hypothetical protein